MPNNIRNPDEYYRWPHSPEPVRRKFGIPISSCVFDIDRFPIQSQATSKGLRLQKVNHTTSFRSVLSVLIDGYLNEEWLSLSDITDRLLSKPTPEIDKRVNDERRPVSYETQTRRIFRMFLNQCPPSIQGDRWQYPIDYPVTKKQVEYTPYEFQDINPLHCGKYLLTNAGFVIADIAKDPPSSGGKIVRNFPIIPINPALG